MNIYITAIIVAKPEFKDEVEAGLKALVPQAKAEPANIEYHLHQDINDKNTFVFYEVWDGEDGVAKHNSQAYFQEFVKMTETKCESVDIHFMKHL